MVTPGWVRPDDKVTTFGNIFKTPIVGKGLTWLPLSQGLTWLGFGGWLSTRHTLPLLQAVLWGLVAMVLFLGAEWCHNFAHVYAAHRVGKRANAIRVLFGLPVLAYFSEDELGVTPREHIIRAAGGPVLNTILGIVALFWFFNAPLNTVSYDLSLIFLSVNAVIVIAGLSPIPFLDGGVILKWGLVQRGKDETWADGLVRSANAVVGILMVGVGAGLLLKQYWFWGSFAIMFALLSFLVAFDLIRQDN